MTRARRALSAALGACTLLSACGAPRPEPVSQAPAPAPTPAPNTVVIAHFNPPRDLALERAPGDTVRVHDATSVIGRLREIRGDTAWIVATVVRSPHDDGRGTLPGWPTAVVNGGRTRVVALSQDTHTNTYADRRTMASIGTGVAVLFAAALAAVTALFIACGITRCLSD